MRQRCALADKASSSQRGDSNHGNHRFACRWHPSRMELVAIDAKKPDNILIFVPSDIEK